MVKYKDVLGINARSKSYLVLNKKQSRKLADSKYLSKKFMMENRIPTPEIVALFRDTSSIEEFDWMSLDDGFVIKPVDGYGGNGVMVVRKPAKYAGEWLLMEGKKVMIEDLKLHVRDIIEGRFSRNGLADEALVERRVKIHPKFFKIAVGGTPDVRVIVFNKVPVMAMLRVPTEESKGKSNLHQGAIGLGIDMATGITTYGVWHDRHIKYFPSSNKKVNGIAIPNWNKVLRIASKIQFRRPGLGYFGVDILLDKDKGPLVIEINDQPGLSIQLANMDGLKKRLERVEGMELKTLTQAVKIARTLFSLAFSRKAGHLGEDKPLIGIFEVIQLKSDLRKRRRRVNVEAKIDTGAYSSSIDEELAKELGLLKPENILWSKVFKSSLGREERQVIMIDFKLKGVVVRAKASVTNRHGLRRKVILGRRDLRRFLVKPSRFKPRGLDGKKIKSRNEN